MTDAQRARAADIMQLRAGHFPRAFVRALDAFASAAEPDARRAAARAVRAWYRAGGMPIPPALDLACGVPS